MLFGLSRLTSAPLESFFVCRVSSCFSFRQLFLWFIRNEQETSCHRSRSRSRSRTKHGRRSGPEQSPPPPSPHKLPRSSNEEQDSLSAILNTLQEVQEDLKHTNNRASSMEKHWHQNVSVFPPNLSVETKSPSVMVH